MLFDMKLRFNIRISHITMFKIKLSFCTFEYFIESHREQNNFFTFI